MEGILQRHSYPGVGCRLEGSLPRQPILLSAFLAPALGGPSICANPTRLFRQINLNSCFIPHRSSLSSSQLWRCIFRRWACPSGRCHLPPQVGNTRSRTTPSNPRLFTLTTHLAARLKTLACAVFYTGLMGGMHGNVHTVHGPSWAEVRLGLTLYRWPSGEKVWEGHIAEQLADPEPGEVMPMYGSMGEVLGMALSRAVGSFLITQAVQDILNS